MTDWAAWQWAWAQSVAPTLAAESRSAVQPTSRLLVLRLPSLRATTRRRRARPSQAAPRESPPPPRVRSATTPSQWHQAWPTPQATSRVAPRQGLRCPSLLPSLSQAPTRWAQAAPMTWPITHPRASRLVERRHQPPRERWPTIA